MNITKKMIDNLIKDDYNEGIIDEELFNKIILNELDLKIITRQNINVLHKAYILYCKGCKYKRINEKLDKLLIINNLKNTNIFYRIINYCESYSSCDENKFYAKSVKEIAYALSINKGINFPVQNELYETYDDNYDFNDLDEIDLKFVKKSKELINKLMENNLYLCCKECHEYKTEKKYNNNIEKNNRIYERENKLMYGAFDYLLNKAIKEEDNITIDFLTRGFNNVICRKSRVKIIEEYIENKNNKYLYDGKRNYFLHNEFKKQLRDTNKYCLISDKELKTNSGLDCCHIKPYCVCSIDECKNGNNGIVLMHKFHVMFDKGFISFDDDGKLLVSPYIPYSDKKELEKYNLNKSNLEIHKNKEKHEFLKWHRQNVFISGKKFDEGFNFNYKITHWTERYEIVKNYLDVYDVSDNNIMKMYDYILYAVDKTLLKPNEPCLDDKHYKILCDLSNGIVSYCDKRNGVKYKTKQNKIIMINENKDRLDKYIKHVGECIKEQKESYYELCNIVSNMNNSDLKGTTKHNILYSLFKDIGECNKAIEDINEVRIKQMTVNRHSLFNNFDFNYNNKIIRNILKNWDLVKSVAHDYPFSYANLIFLDMDKALKLLKLTNKQELSLYKTLKNMPLTDEERGDYKNVVNKIYNILNKN